MDWQGLLTWKPITGFKMLHPIYVSEPQLFVSIIIWVVGSGAARRLRRVNCRVSQAFAGRMTWFGLVTRIDGKRLPASHASLHRENKEPNIRIGKW
jgi:hypothetical protein